MDGSPFRTIGTAVFFFLLGVAVLLDLVVVEGHSMAPAIHHDDRVLVHRSAYGLLVPIINVYAFTWNRPKSGDIIVFESPENSRLVVKRVDSVLVETGTGRDLVTVLGENPEVSLDSRGYGTVPLSAVRGRVVRTFRPVRRSAIPSG